MLEFIKNIPKGRRDALINAFIFLVLARVAGYLTKQVHPDGISQAMLIYLHFAMIILSTYFVVRSFLPFEGDLVISQTTVKPDALQDRNVETNQNDQKEKPTDPKEEKETGENQ